MKRSLSLKTILSRSSDSSMDRHELVQVNCKKCLAPVPADAAHLHVCPNWQIQPDPPSPSSRQDIETKTGTKTKGFVIQVKEEQPLEPEVSYLETGQPVSNQTREAVLEQAAAVVADKIIKDREEQPRYHEIPPSAPPTLPPPLPPIPPLQPSQPRRVQAVQVQVGAQAVGQAVDDSKVGHHSQNVDKQIAEEADKIATALTDKISSQLAQQQQEFQERMLLLLSQPSSRSTSRSSSSVSSRRSSRTTSRHVSPQRLRKAMRKLELENAPGETENGETENEPKAAKHKTTPSKQLPVFFPPPPISSNINHNSINPTADDYPIQPNGVITSDTIQYWREAQRAVRALPDLKCDKIQTWTELNSRKHHSVLNNAPKLAEANRMQWPSFLQDSRIFCIQFNIDSALFLELVKIRLYDSLRVSVSTHVQQGFLTNESDLIKFLDTEIYSGLSYSVTREKFRRYNQQSRLEGHAFSKIANIISQRQVGLLARLHPLATADSPGRCDQATLQKILLHDLLMESLTQQERAQLGSVGLLDSKDVDQLIKAQSTFSLFATKQSNLPDNPIPTQQSSLAAVSGLPTPPPPGQVATSDTASSFLNSLLNDVPPVAPVPSGPQMKKADESQLVTSLKKEITALRRKMSTAPGTAAPSSVPPAATSSVPPPPRQPSSSSQGPPRQPQRRQRSKLCAQCRQNGVPDTGVKCGHCYVCARDKGLINVWGQCPNEICRSKYKTFLDKLSA